MKIPVFVSCPTDLSQDQESFRQVILNELDALLLEPRALGRSDYPTDFPLKEVLVVAKHCAGGIVLGFCQYEFPPGGMVKKGTPLGKQTVEVTKFPTPWNNLEAGILFGLNLPMLVFKEDNISGGVFDAGVTDVFVHKIPDSALTPDATKQLKEVLLKWQAKVRAAYYSV